MVLTSVTFTFYRFHRETDVYIGVLFSKLNFCNLIGSAVTPINDFTSVTFLWKKPSEHNKLKKTFLLKKTEIFYEQFYGV